ncbi:anaerobic glycerol-3-phosphate dehydrogenase subunit C [Deferribacterales bacterium Es71-Z0220]|uniref:anaerobic glycerol-3-phosphate dehydrogenase subunit C n=1 Tax=Deferrivibrio essentukiensis TaxID=2880922 RepID=UPI001F605ADF|nr:anaerobic glycerol-3-phosphate dehydrogenase subunit C [Deferrivibrio essentukiensis]MCB4203599.1 anaerobic glycerol-3-phosphate dehydrogenase subunit C [Deferrivibrio essentukiensis]
MPQLTDNIFEELSEIFEGDIYTDKLRRNMLATDGSIFKVEPACVAYPKNDSDVTKVINFAKKYGLSVHSRGAGSGLCGSAIGKGIVLDFSKYMNKLIKIDFEKKYFECEPGYRFGELEELLKGKGLFFPPDPSSGEYATFGGMFGTNASGAHSVKYGNVSDYIIDADFILSNGKKYSLSEIYNTPYENLDEPFKSIFEIYTHFANKIENSYPHVKYNVAGYNLRGMIQNEKLFLGKLLGGSEGTLAVVTKLKFSLKEKPKYDSLVVAYFDDIISSAKAVQKVLPLGVSGIEIMDKSLLQLAKENDEKLRDKIPDGIDNVLLIEFDSFSLEETESLAKKARGILFENNLTENAHIAVSEEEKEKFWAIRKAAVPILYKLKGRKKILALIEDAAVPIDKLVDYFEGVYKILAQNKLNFVVYGHIAKGLMHTRPLMDLKDPHDVDLLKKVADEFFELIFSLGGTVSGEHGDGRIRSCYIQKQYKDIYPLFAEIKHLMDEYNILNPEIKTYHDPNQVKKFLRYGSDYRSVEIFDKLLDWPENFLDEVEKCHGCSKCTTVTTATRMCPIYKFTRDEAAAPKAKANILRALISGAIAEKSLYEKSFQYVIDRCVNCGSCYKECPSNVNIPKMAIEARSKYVEKFGATLENRLIVSAELAARVTRKFSKLLGKPMKLKMLRKVGEIFTGVTAEREFIAFETKSLFERFDKTIGNSEKSVMFFSGCYAGYIKPQIGEAAIKVLEKIGYKVFLPEQNCCGLPMLSKGMAKQAKNKIEQNLENWEKLIDSVDYIVVTCSSCGLSLKQEWKYLLNNDIINKISEKTIHISSLVNMHFDKLNIVKNDISVSYHMPCHLKVQNDSGSSVAMLKKINPDGVEDLKSHCCGMAGSWGISAKNYDLSVEIGSNMINKLNASAKKVGATDCPTCRMQMEHLSTKKIIHPIEVLAECLAD